MDPRLQLGHVPGSLLRQGNSGQLGGELPNSNHVLSSLYIQGELSQDQVSCHLHQDLLLPTRLDNLRDSYLGLLEPPLPILARGHGWRDRFAGRKRRRVTEWRGGWLRLTAFSCRSPGSSCQCDNSWISQEGPGCVYNESNLVTFHVNTIFHVVVLLGIAFCPLMSRQDSLLLQKASDSTSQEFVLSCLAA